MKKKILLLMLSITLLMTACGNQKVESSSDQNTDQTTEQNQKSVSSSKESSSDLEDIGSVEVDKGLTEVELTIPKEFVGETTQEELDALCKEYKFDSIKLNQDGSATYKMSRTQHNEYMKQYRSQINTSLSELVGSNDYPNFTDISANDDFTEFTVTTKSTELDLNESFSVMAFYTYGGLYNIFNGTPVDNVTVTFVNAESGDIIASSSSADTNNK